MKLYDQLMMNAAEAARNVAGMTPATRTFSAVYYYGVAAGWNALNVIDADIDTVEKKLLMLFDLPVGSIREAIHGNDTGQPRETRPDTGEPQPPETSAT